MTIDAKDPDVQATYAIDWHKDLVQRLARDTKYAQNAVVRAVVGTGVYYRCTIGGRTAAWKPSRLPRRAGETLQDGSATFVAVHPDDATVPTVQSATWTVPTGLTLVSQSEDDTRTSITLSGGADGEDYSVTCRMTPSAGDPVEKTIVIRVRSL